MNAILIMRLPIKATHRFFVILFPCQAFYFPSPLNIFESLAHHVLTEHDTTAYSKTKDIRIFMAPSLFSSRFWRF